MRDARADRSPAISRLQNKPSTIGRRAASYFVNAVTMDRSQTMKGQHIGELEELVLLAVCGLGENAYGVPVQQRIEDAAGP